MHMRFENPIWEERVSLISQICSRNSKKLSLLTFECLDSAAISVQSEELSACCMIGFCRLSRFSPSLPSGASIDIVKNARRNAL